MLDLYKRHSRSELYFPLPALPITSVGI